MSQDNPNLDFLRAWAVLCVLASHVLNYFSFSIGPIGLWGVDIFFVHTTLVLMFSLKRLQHEFPAPLATQYKRFLIRRAFRIFPLATITTLLIFWMGAPLVMEGPTFQWSGADGSDLFENLLLIQNVTLAPSIQSPLWTLPLEVQMYLLLPAIFFLICRVQSPMRLALALWALAAVVGFLTPGAVRLRNFLPHIPWTLFVAAPCFLAGVVAYVSTARGRVPAFWWPLVVFAITTCFLVTAPWDTQALFCLALGLAIPNVRTLSSPWLVNASRMIARYSYGIYLTHLFALWFALEYSAGAGVPVIARWGLFALLVVVLPVAFYHAIEAPMIRMGASFTRPKAVKTMVTA